MRCGGVRRGGEFLYACLHLMLPCGTKLNMLVWPGIVLMSFPYMLLEFDRHCPSVQLFGWDNGVTGKSNLHVYVRVPRISGCPGNMLRDTLSAV